MKILYKNGKNHMKKIIDILIAIIICTQNIDANTMSIMNSLSQQAVVTLNSATEKYSIAANPNENMYVQKNLDNATNQYDNPLPHLDYGQNQIRKVTIQRMQSDVPQIIYYNDEITSDKSNKPTGIYGTFASRSGFMQITQDNVTINNLTYNVNDLSSFKIRCLKLKNQLLSNKDIHSVEQETNDILQALRIIEQSDMAQNFSLQISLIKLELDDLVNKIQIIHEVKQYNNSLQDIQKKLTPNNVDEVETKLNSLTAGLQTLDASGIQSILDVEKIKKEITDIESQITSIKSNLNSTDHVILADQ